MSNTPRLILPGQRGPQQLVRNVVTERVLPCCYGDCDKPGDNRIQVSVPHPTPRWKDPATGTQEMLVYIFCSGTCKAAYLVGSPYADRA